MDGLVDGLIDGFAVRSMEVDRTNSELNGLID
jgi:hypothetical protein